jgi:hypothetical protein
MNKRERLLVGLMVVALLYAGYALFIDRAPDAGTARRGADPATDVHLFAADARQRVERMELTTEDRHVLDMAVAEWAASPFIDRPDAARPAAERPAEIRYTGFFRMGENRLAIINGREYRVNETIQATDLRIESIGPDQVVLVTPTGGRRVTVPIVQSANIGE